VLAGSHVVGALPLRASSLRHAMQSLQALPLATRSAPCRRAATLWARCRFAPRRWRHVMQCLQAALLATCGAPDLRAATLSVRCRFAPPRSTT
jgi:hypothetical protein